MSDQRFPPLRPQSPVRRARRQATPWPMIIGVVLLGFLAVVLAMVLFGADDDGAATETSSPTPVTSASATAAAAASAAPPSASSAPGAFAADAVVVTAVEALTLRAGPALAAEAQWRLPAGTGGFVIGGPVDADGFRWYQLSGMGLPYATGCVTPEPGEMLTCPAFLGWVAANAEDGTPWLEAATAPGCPAEPHIVVLSELAYTLRLICFDAAPITFVAWWPELPEDAGGGEPCAAAGTDVGWLVCQGTNDNVLSADPSETSGAGGRWPISLDPSSGVGMPARGQWVEVTGHFDDPVAQRCGEVAEPMSADAGALVFGCRLQFVVSAAVVSAGP